ncbi:ABC transporter permease [Spongiactinospora sp. TRM90649]|uniref:ABC transporter permease n=1 Tax=Spongiactinospora sp. TRM90649 TaxID=3031114 RepID=UPI0023F764E2|nr:ABC transporter permease [Spongiactinospora sp. TRM90649]MDF5751305.1 ABC transporter permease [Spongiactinospora sp. TRM90649]
MKAAVLQRVLLTAAGVVVAVLVAIGISSVAIAVAGADPTTALTAMFDFGTRPTDVADGVAFWLNRSVALFIAGLAVAIGFRMNLFNIGVEGQYRMAALVSAFVGGQLMLPAPIHLTVIIVVAMVVGGLYALIPALLKVYRGVNEVISTIMLNFVAVGVAAYLVRGPFGGERVEGQLIASTSELPQSAWFPDANFLLTLLGLPAPRGGGLYGFILIAALLGVLVWLILERTRFGFDVKASGLNGGAALAAGIDPRRMVISAMVLSGAVAGLIGLPEMLGRSHAYGTSGFTAGLGFLGIAVALLGRNRPVGIALAALLFGFLDRAATPMQFADIPPSVIAIIQGMIVLMVVIVNEVTRRIALRWEERRAAGRLAETPSAPEGAAA